MTRSLRAPGLHRWTLAAAMVCAAAASAGRAALAQSVSATKAADGSDDERRVKIFDWDERRRGNYEDTPMYWQRLTGDGLPAYSSGRLDDTVGHVAPPSFLFTLKGGNIAYEYAQPDLKVTPNSDYLIEAYVRAEGLEYARTLMACYLVNEAGERVAGSEHVSQAVRSDSGSSAGDVPWQRIEIPLHVGSSGAGTLRLQLWVAQDYVLREPDATVADPIIRQEVDARIWFDDITIVRVPHLALRFSNAGGIVKPGADEALQLDVNNATLGLLTAELTVSNEAGANCLSKSFELAPRAAESFRIPVPALPPGLYHADAHLLTDGTVVIRRSIRFAILPELPPTVTRTPDIGVYLGQPAVGDAEGAVELIGNLGSGAIKVGLPTVSVPQTSDETERLRQVRDLVRRLRLAGVETTGVIVSAGWAQSPERALSTYHMLASDEAWPDRVGPVLAYFGNALSSWQFGFEPLELREALEWNGRAIDRLRQAVERFAAVPQLVVPRSIFDDDSAAELLDPEPADAESGKTGGKAAADSTLSRASTYSFWLPAALPARAFPWHLAAWFDQGSEREQSGPGRWLSLGLERDADLPSADRLTDMARRIVLARAANPERVYVPAPFELTSTGGDPTWQPTDEYIPLRTLLHYLSGRRTMAALRLPHEAVGLLFRQGQAHTLVVWTWQADADGAGVELCVGPRASAVDLTGQPRALESDGPRVRIPLSPTPLIVVDVNAALLLFEESLRVEPAFIQLCEPEPRPVLTLRNPYPVELAGTIDLQPPAGWNVTPNPIHIQLGPGETLAETLMFDIPPRQVAAEQELGAAVHLARPETIDLHFNLPLQVGLKNIVVKASAHWDGNDLVVEQTLENLSATSVNFNSFCQPPARAQLEGVFLNVRPGEKGVQIYRLPVAQGLGGTRLWMGVQEIGGRRTLDHLVVIPR